MRRALYNLFIYICCILCFAVFTEFYLRKKGFPCELSRAQLKDRLELNEEIGYVPANLHYTYTLPAQEGSADGYFATITRWGDSARASYPAPRKPSAKRVLLLGCSYTAGEGVEDYETYAWHLNEYFHDYVFENHAMNGFSTYKCYLYEKQILERHNNNHYDLVLYGAIRDHFRRNVAYVTMYLDELLQPVAEANDSTQPVDHIFQHSDSQIWLYPTVYLKHDHTLGYNPAFKRWPGDEDYVSINLLKHIYWFCHTIRIMNTLPQGGESEESVEVFQLLLDKMDECAQQHGAKFATIYLENEKDGPITQLNWDKYPIIFATDGFEGDNDDPKYHVGGIKTQHPNGIVHKNWAKHIHEGLIQAGLLSESTNN